MPEDNPLLRSFSEQPQTVGDHSEQAPLLGSLSEQASSLGSLSQAARHKQLNTARGILIVVGILTVLFNLAFFALIESQVNDEIKKQVNELHKKGLQEDPASVAAFQSKMIRIAQLFQGGAVALGVVFIILGCLVKKYPVSSTITGMVLYIGSNALFGYLDPETLARGLIIKIIIVFVLAKSIQAAIAYQREQTILAIEVPPVPL
ncbi:MAG: hypothetical protein ABSE63_14715 [Thermoguttaceae bacterium]|jgi:hypothetical protein